MGIATRTGVTTTTTTRVVTTRKAPPERVIEARPDQMHGFMGRMSGLWGFLMALNIAAQVLAMRWMLKTKWPDFRLKAVSED
jgi:hypothetical protein